MHIVFPHWSKLKISDHFTAVSKTVYPSLQYHDYFKLLISITINEQLLYACFN